MPRLAVDYARRDLHLKHKRRVVQLQNILLFFTRRTSTRVSPATPATKSRRRGMPNEIFLTLPIFPITTHACDVIDNSFSRDK